MGELNATVRHREGTSSIDLGGEIDIAVGGAPASASKEEG
jgi:hypothetical protein